ncbi:MAG: HD-GYP domain-containing protein [Candidatus Riflebacteria bacterium]|nr:HD-GYP domain-containing protein [Candidatus Riflebacteria bacterium]
MNTPRKISIVVFLLLSSFLSALEPTKARTGEIDQIWKALNELKAHDFSSFEHCCHVASYAEIIANNMGLKPEDVQEIYLEGMVHDIGKLDIPTSILNKPGKLTPEEFGKIKTHPIISEKILSKYPFLKNLIKAAKEHHERWDGKGYPRGISGNQISIEGRIIAVADAFDVMTSKRPYGKPKSNEEAILELIDKKGTQFDPAVVDSTVLAIKSHKIVIQPACK